MVNDESSDLVNVTLKKARNINISSLLMFPIVHNIGICATNQLYLSFYELH